MEDQKTKNEEAKPAFYVKVVLAQEGTRAGLATEYITEEKDWQAMRACQTLPKLMTWMNESEQRFKQDQMVALKAKREKIDAQLKEMGAR